MEHQEGGAQGGQGPEAIPQAGQAGASSGGPGDPAEAVDFIYKRSTAFQDTLQVVWDSTTVEMAERCHRLYYYEIIRGLRPKDEALPLTFGGAYHKGQEIRVKENLHAGIQAALAEFPILDSPDKARTRDTLVRSLVWWDRQYQNDPVKVLETPNGPAVELSFQFDVAYGLENTTISFSGHFDALVEFQGLTFVLDYKTTTKSPSSYFWDRFELSNQVSLYTFASQEGTLHMPAQGVIIDAAFVQITQTQFQRAPIRRTRSNQQEWLAKTFRTIERVQEIQARGHEHVQKATSWSPNHTACMFCNFRQVCRTDKSMREELIKHDFRPNLWDPADKR